MKQKRVFLISGVSGSGKSTWVKDRLGKYGGEWISRDNIRFSMLNEDDDYFAKETLVFNEFIRQAQAAIDDENVNDIYIDATHLSQGSRNKTMKRLNLDNVGMTICVSFDVPIGICKARNALREGRARVPDKVIENMRTSFTIPVCGFNETWVINEEGMRVDDLANF